MAMMLDYAPGMSLTDPWVLTNTRTTGATFWDSLGVVRTAAIGVTRDRHYPLGPVDGRRTTLFEPASTNFCLQSQTFDSATWATKNNVTVGANAIAGPDLTVTADKLIENTDVAQVHRIGQAITITSLENLSIACYVKTAGRTRLRVGISDGAFSAKFYADVNLTTGIATAVGATGGVATGVAIVPLGDSWFWVGAWGTLPAGTAANVDILLEDGAGAATYNGDGTSGVYLWGAQVERFGALPSPPTSYLVTTTLTASRTTDAVNTPYPFPTFPIWGYAQFIDLGWASQANFNPLFRLSNAGGTGSRVALITGSSVGGANPGQYRFGYNADFAASTAAIINSAVRGYGTLVELFWRQLADGTSEISASANGGAVTTVSSGGANNPPQIDYASPTLLWLCANPAALVGLRRLKLGADPTRITTLKLAAAA